MEYTTSDYGGCYEYEYNKQFSSVGTPHVGTPLKWTLHKRITIHFTNVCAGKLPVYIRECCDPMLVLFGALHGIVLFL